MNDEHREDFSDWTNFDLTYEIGCYQAVQKRNPMSSEAWQKASEALAPLFAEMARRQQEGLL